MEKLAYFAEKWQQEGRFSLLDFGCGDGEDTVAFVEKGFWVTAADEKEEYVTWLRQWEKQSGKILRSKCCKLEQLPFAENAFDCVWAYHRRKRVHLELLQKRIGQICRVLRPQGKFCLGGRAEMWEELSTFLREQGFVLCEKLETEEEGELSFCAEWQLNKKAEALDYSPILGRQVSGRIDRPLGTRHSVYKNLCYPLNYGYVEGVFGGDGEEQDIYLLGEDKPVESFCGTVVAVVHRFNDVEDKWVVDASKRRYSKEEIQKALDFQEKYFYSEIYVL